MNGNSDIKVSGMEMVGMVDVVVTIAGVEKVVDESSIIGYSIPVPVTKVYRLEFESERDAELWISAAHNPGTYNIQAIAVEQLKAEEQKCGRRHFDE